METLIHTNAIGAPEVEVRPSPNDMDVARKLIVSESSRICAAQVEGRARAIVLTGSMSRGETTLKRDGRLWRVLGDATFLIVSGDPIELQLKNLEQEIERSLLQLRVRCKVVVVTATTANLRNMKPHIYAYELRERGIVVWGDKDVLSEMPSFAAAEIPVEDGWWLLCNRMIEQLESATTSGTVDDNCTAVRYRIAKLYLAMAASYLLAMGCYEPSYKDRAARLQELADSQAAPSSPIPLQRFSKFVAICTDLKLQGEIDEKISEFPRWSDAVSDAETLWRWMVARISGLDYSRSRKELLTALIRRQSIFARAKGWLRAVYVQPAAFRKHGLRWTRLACDGSPRYLVYGAASELFFAGAAPGAVTLSELIKISANLPLPPHTRKQLSWAEVASSVAHNFHLLLESTRC
jgi:hypothetical protein